MRCGASPQASVSTRSAPQPGVGLPLGGTASIVSRSRPACMKSDWPCCLEANTVRREDQGPSMAHLFGEGNRPSGWGSFRTMILYSAAGVMSRSFFALLLLRRERSAGVRLQNWEQFMRVQGTRHQKPPSPSPLASPLGSAPLRWDFLGANSDHGISRGGFGRAKIVIPNSHIRDLHLLKKKITSRTSVKSHIQTQHSIMFSLL